jgi:hypothetical protein
VKRVASVCMDGERERAQGPFSHHGKKRPRQEIMLSRADEAALNYCFPHLFSQPRSRFDGLLLAEIMKLLRVHHHGGCKSGERMECKSAGQMRIFMQQ